MRYRRMILPVFMALFLTTPLTAYSDDVDDLKAAFARAGAAIREGDLDAIAASTHDQWMGFFPNIPFPVDGKAAQRQMWQAIFVNREQSSSNLINMQYRVVGTTGVVMGYMRITVKPKDGPAHTNFVRVLSTWSKVDGKWLGVGTHASYMPSGD